MLSWAMVILHVLTVSGPVVCVCVCLYSGKQWLLPMQPEVMMQSEAPAGCNEAPCSSTLPHQAYLCLSAQQARVCTAPCLATKPHTHTHNLPSPPALMLIVFLFLFPTSASCALLSHSSILFTPTSPSSTPPPSSSLSPPPAAGVPRNWAVVNSTLTWISSVATSGWRRWPRKTRAK